jgi:hypothetical protein
MPRSHKINAVASARLADLWARFQASELISAVRALLPHGRNEMNSITDEDHKRIRAKLPRCAEVRGPFMFGGVPLIARG